MDNKKAELELITELNRLLQPIQAELSSTLIAPKLPMTLIIGCPRSGTTLLNQYLAATKAWYYPTNFITRFSSATYIGALIQELLNNNDFGLLKQEPLKFNSELGHSLGAFNTNEFFHFWRRFFPNEEICYLNKQKLNVVKLNEMLSELALIERISKKPFLSKGLMFQYNLPFFSDTLKNTIFLYIKRNPVYAMQSIYESRLKSNQNIEEWWSAKPHAFKELKDKCVYEQIAGQVYYSQLEIEQGLCSVHQNNKLVISYEKFIANPNGVIAMLINKYTALGYDLVLEPVAEHTIKSNNTTRLNKHIITKLNFFYNQFINKKID